MRRREFLQAIAAAAVAGLPVDASHAAEDADGERFYAALEPFGNVALLHFTDCHAQLLPMRFREPSVNLGVGDARGKPPHLVGEALLRQFGIAPGTRDAHAFTYLDFDARRAGVRRDGRFRASRDADQAAARRRARCAAARRRRHVAGLGDVVVDAAARTWSTRRSCSAST